MKVFSVVVLTLLLLSAVLVPQVEARQMSLEAEGEVSIYSKSGNQRTQTATLIEGEGYVNYTGDTTIRSTSVNQGYGIELISAEDTDNLLTGVVSTRMLNGEGAQYYYALKIVSNPATAAILDLQYRSHTELFANLDIEAEAFVEDGIFRSYVDLYNPVIGSSIYEEIYVDGYAWYLDLISISDPDEE